jgi:hypothetical protein
VFRTGNTLLSLGAEILSLTQTARRTPAARSLGSQGERPLRALLDVNVKAPASGLSLSGFETVSARGNGSPYGLDRRILPGQCRGVAVPCSVRRIWSQERLQSALPSRVTANEIMPNLRVQVGISIICKFMDMHES